MFYNSFHDEQSIQSVGIWLRLTRLGNRRKNRLVVMEKRIENMEEGEGNVLLFSSYTRNKLPFRGKGSGAKGF